MVYPALLPLMRTARLPVVDWTDAHADLNGPFRFAERGNLVSARVPSHFKRVPSHFKRVPSHFKRVPSHFKRVPSHFKRVPSHFKRVPSHFKRVPSHFKRVPSHFKRSLIHSCVNLEFQTAVIMVKTVIWDVTPCSVVEICQPFRVNVWLHLYCPEDGSTMSIETFINFYQTDSATSKKTPPFVITVFLTPIEMARLV